MSRLKVGENLANVALCARSHALSRVASCDTAVPSDEPARDANEADPQNDFAATSARMRLPDPLGPFVEASVPPQRPFPKVSPLLAPRRSVPFDADAGVRDLCTSTEVLGQYAY